MGDVSLGSNSSSAHQTSHTAHWAYGNTEKTQHEELAELESFSQPINCSTTALYMYSGTTTTTDEKAVEEMNSYHRSLDTLRCHAKHSDTPDKQDLESCGTLAFMSSANSIDSAVDSCEREGDVQDLESCGTLAFMSSANSNISGSVCAERQIPHKEDGSRSATSTMVFGNSWVKYDFSTDVNETDLDEIRSDDFDWGDDSSGVTPSASTESAELREKKYEMLIKSGNTVGLSALKQLSSSTKQHSTERGNSTTALRGFSNPLCGEQNSKQGRPRPLQYAFPPPVQVPLTSWPRFPLTVDQTLSVLSTPALL